MNKRGGGEHSPAEHRLRAGGHQREPRGCVCSIISRTEASGSGGGPILCQCWWVGGGGLALCQPQPERLFSSGGGVGAPMVGGGGFSVQAPQLQSTHSAPAMSIGIWLIHLQWVHVSRKCCFQGPAFSTKRPRLRCNVALSLHSGGSVEVTGDEGTIRGHEPAGEAPGAIKGGWGGVGTCCFQQHKE